MIIDQKHYNILIVEDNPGDLLLIKDSIEDVFSSSHITNAKSFQEALKILNETNSSFDVILLDLSLPDKTGKDLITRILEKNSLIPIIVLTGYTDFAFSVESISLGASDYLLKDDISPMALYKSIVYSIERKRISLELKESESRYSNLFHLSPQPMWICDLDTMKYVQVNKFAVQRYGYSEEEFLNMTFLDLQEEQENIQPFTIHTKNVLTNPNEEANPFLGRFKHLTKSGEQLEVDIYSNPIRIKDKNYGFIIGIDVTEMVLFDNKITKAILQAQENERYEIGGELHDNVCQLLATCQLGLGMIEENIQPEKFPIYVQSKELLSKSLHEIRNLSHRLAPSFFSDTTLKESLDDLLNTFNVANKFTIDLNVSRDVQNFPLSREVHLNLFRILQEQLRNISKYANATNIPVDVSCTNKKIKMTVSDNGVGFDPESVKGGIGFTNMRRRVELFDGTLTIQSAKRQGCTITIEIPLKECFEK